LERSEKQIDARNALGGGGEKVIHARVHGTSGRERNLEDAMKRARIIATAASDRQNCNGITHDTSLWPDLEPGASHTHSENQRRWAAKPARILPPSSTRLN